MRRLTRLAADQEGASLVEMALVAPMLAALLIGMVDISRAYSDQLELEQAAQRTIEKVMQQSVDPEDYEDELSAEAAAAAGVPESDVVPDAWLECDGVRASDWDSTCSAGQAYARYVSVAVNRDFTPMFGTKYFPGANADGSITLTGEAGIRVQ